MRFGCGAGSRLFTGVKDLAHRYGALLIFDEVITGFRWARGGAQEYFGVSPDLCAMGKGNRQWSAAGDCCWHAQSHGGLR